MKVALIVPWNASVKGILPCICMLEDGVDRRSSHSINLLSTLRCTRPDTDIGAEAGAGNLQNDGGDIQTEEEVGANAARAERETVPECHEVEEERVIKHTNAQHA